MVHPTTYRTLFFVLLGAWCIFYLPSILFRKGPAKEGTVHTSDDRPDRVISFVCTTQRPSLTIPMNGPRHRLAINHGVEAEALERTLAAACGWNPPVLLYNIKAAMVMLTSDIPQDEYYVFKPESDKGVKIDLTSERKKWEREVRPQIYDEIRRELEDEFSNDNRQDDEDIPSDDSDARPSPKATNSALKDRIEQDRIAALREDYHRRIGERQNREREKYQARISKKYRQTSPPRGDAKLIYPNPMRHPSAVEGNITFVTAAINIKRKSHAGKAEHEYKFEDDYLEILKILLSWHRPLQIIMQRKYYEMLAAQNVIHDQAVIRIVETDDLRSWKYYNAIENIRKRPDWQSIASWLPDSPQGYNDLYNPLIMNKIYWMKDLCHQNPFNTKYFMWVDCGVCTTYVSGDMAEFLAPRYERMMAPGFLATNSPRDGGDEIQGFLRWKLEEMAGTHTTHMMKGGTFGGTCEQIDAFVDEYDRVLSESLAEGFLGTEESLFTIVFYRMREMFHEFRQERPESIGDEALCLMNDRFYHIPEFGEKYVEGVGEPWAH